MTAPILRSKLCTANRSKDGNCHFDREALIGYLVLWRYAAQHKGNLLAPGRISEVWPPKTRGERQRPTAPLMSSRESQPCFWMILRAFQVFVFILPLPGIMPWWFSLSVTTSVAYLNILASEIICSSHACALHWIPGDLMFLNLFSIFHKLELQWVRAIDILPYVFKCTVRISIGVDLNKVDL